MKALMLLIPCLFPVLLSAQINNGSFESNDSLASLAGWDDSCQYGTSAEDAPPGGGKWCLRLQASNTQGCFPAYMIQTLTGIENGDLYRLSAWVLSESGSNASISLGKKDSSGNIHILSRDSSMQNQWTLVFTEFRFQLGSTDTPVVVLQAGFSGGPAAFWAKFDVVTIEKTTALERFPERLSRAISLPYPNPAKGFTHFDIDLPQQWHNAQLVMYNILGKEVLRRALTPGKHQMELSLEEFNPGAYFYQIRTPQGNTLSKKLVVFN